MAKVRDLKQSKYLAKEDCGPQGLKLIIAGWEEQDVSMESEPSDVRYVLNFRGLDPHGKPIKNLVLNLTNGERIQSVTGSDDLDDWVGHEIILFNDPDVMFAGKRVGGIRVFVPQKTPGVAQQQAQSDSPPPATDADVPPETGNPNWVGDNPPKPPEDDIPFDQK